MGDKSTHVIFYQGYWHLVHDDDGEWFGLNFVVICKVGGEEKIIALD